MKAEQHRMVAKWHLEQANQHDADEAHSCGCPVEHAVMTNGEILKVMKARPVQEPYVRGPLTNETSQDSNPRNGDYTIPPKVESTYKERMKSREELDELR